MNKTIILGLSFIFITFISNTLAFANEHIMTNDDKNNSSNVSISINKTNDKQTIQSSKLNDKKHILGIPIKDWRESLDNLKYQYDDDFLLKIETEGNNLKNKRDSECFTKLNSEENINVNKKNNNPLLQLKHKKSNSKYITDLDLEKSDFIKTISLLPILNVSYDRDEIAKFIPYIALGLNYGMNINELNFYLKDDARKEVPVDIATQRIYNIINNN